jgi:hypothetical protein
MPARQKGEQFAVPVDPAAMEGAEVFVLFRPGERAVVLGAGGSRTAAEALRARLGSAAAAYEIAAVPVENG